VCWYDKRSWHGCMTVNVSELDGMLGFECVCGEDTRDFRRAKNMPGVMKALRTEYSMNHRQFGKQTSSFLAVKKVKG
jgi:hypothetical protein